MQYIRRCDEGHHFSFYQPDWGTRCATCWEWLYDTPNSIGICRDVKHRQYRCHKCCQIAYWRNILNGHRHGDVIPRYERTQRTSWHADDAWRIRIGGSNPADEDFLQASRPATGSSGVQVDEHTEALAQLRHPSSSSSTSSTARAHARWQWLTLQLITEYSHCPFDYVAPFITAFHNPIRRCFIMMHWT